MYSLKLLFIALGLFQFTLEGPLVFTRCDGTAEDAEGEKSEKDEKDHDKNYDPDSQEYFQDTCDGCQSLFNQLDQQDGGAKKIRSQLRFVTDAGVNSYAPEVHSVSGDINMKGKSVDYSTSESRAIQILEDDVCRMCLGPTRTKCQRLVEEHEEDIIEYLRKGKHDPWYRVRFCSKYCGPDWTAKTTAEIQAKLDEAAAKSQKDEM
ncbi:hypothetical protein XU18_1959 [Perkinsela sp. CCAP 1560/4]|nr:hypothetical protein XU18_1959 [Perkinsela sp. CCAP 1560/4]|eukprot:KNH07427.1 hypothetical protein XU18_1959 [Perkinsela sp. CCAP 1560/4]